MARIFFASITANSSCGVPEILPLGGKFHSRLRLRRSREWVWMSIRGNFARSTCDSLTSQHALWLVLRKVERLWSGRTLRPRVRPGLRDGCDAPAIKPCTISHCRRFIETSLLISHVIARFKRWRDDIHGLVLPVHRAVPDAATECRHVNLIIGLCGSGITRCAHLKLKPGTR